MDSQQRDGQVGDDLKFSVDDLKDRVVEPLKRQLARNRKLMTTLVSHMATAIAEDLAKAEREVLERFSQLEDSVELIAQELADRDDHKR